MSYDMIDINPLSIHATLLSGYSLGVRNEMVDLMGRLTCMEPCQIYVHADGQRHSQPHNDHD